MSATSIFRSVNGGYPTFQTSLRGSDFATAETRTPSAPVISKLNPLQVRFSSGAFDFIMDVSTGTCTIDTTDTGGASTNYTDAALFFKALNQLYTTNNITL